MSPVAHIVSQFPNVTLASLLFGTTMVVPLPSFGQSVTMSLASSSSGITLPDAPAPQGADPQPATSVVKPSEKVQPTLLGTPKRMVLDEVQIITSPARLRSHDLIWLLPVAEATAASLVTDTKTMRDVVSHNADFDASASTSPTFCVDFSSGHQ